MSVAEVTHGVTAVAELKLGGGAYGHYGTWCHPRRHRRGRIEACSLASVAGVDDESPTASPPWPN